MGKRKGLKLADILVTIIISLVFAVIYKVWGPVYSIVSTLGLHLEQLIYGMWFIAATAAYLIIRKPGVALLAELAAAHGEFIFGGQWGLSTLVYGLAQGMLAELVFAVFRYNRFSLGVASLAAVGSAAASLYFDLYYGYIESLAWWNLTMLIVMRLIGSVLIAGVFAYYLVKALEATGVTALVRPVSKEDYSSLK